MGWRDKLYDKLADNSLPANTARTNIQKRIKEGRIVFLSADKILYTDRQGVKQEVSFDEMAVIIVDKTKHRDDLIKYFGITYDTIKNMLGEEYNKRAKQ